MKKLLLIISTFFFMSFSFSAVNINTASTQELQSLEGIGPTKAKAIVDYRTKNGQFKTVDDIKNVKGIGDKTLNVIKKDITISGTTEIKEKTPKAKKSTDANKGNKVKK